MLTLKSLVSRFNSVRKENTMNTQLLKVLRMLQAEARAQREALDLEQYHLCSGVKYKKITCEHAGSRNLCDRVLGVQSKIFEAAHKSNIYN